MNAIKTGLLLAALTLILVIGGQAVAGQRGMTIALIFAAIMNLGAYFWSDKITLAMSGAQPVTPDQAPRMYRVMERLCARTGLPMPRLYVIPQAQPNAFATGRNPQHAAVAATAGLLETMEEDELEGVLAHELAHVRNRDTLIMSVAATIAGAITYLAYMGQWALIFGGYGGRDRNGGGSGLGALLMIILAPIAALLVQMAISRQREYAADAAAARFVGHPYGLANALEKLGHYSKRIPMHDVKPAQAHMYIVQPFSGGFASLFSTHPPVEERIRRLRVLAS
ncbi:MAG TPA: zinc metalloprotease HtpX [Candidatus Acidoferrales bacterium]|nr:zinc metalloprotease HtpX [Candidatus Acidoferrales bacterium]